jgi:hypothetical protein
MPPSDACYYVTDPPEFDYIDGLFHIRQRLDGRIVERVMRPHVFLLALRRAAEVARAHRMGGAVVIPFAREDDEEAAASH